MNGYNRNFKTSYKLLINIILKFKNPSILSGVTDPQSQLKSHTFTVIVAVLKHHPRKMASETEKFNTFHCRLPPISELPTEDTKANSCAERNQIETD